MRTYRASPGIYAMLGTITSALAVLWLVAVLSFRAPWQPVVLPFLGFVAACVWLSRFRVTVGAEEVVVHVPFARPRRCAVRDILSVEFPEVAGRGRDPMSLCIRMSTGESVRLSVKVFPSQAVRELLALSPG